MYCCSSPYRSVRHDNEASVQIHLRNWELHEVLPDLISSGSVPPAFNSRDPRFQKSELPEKTGKNCRQDNTFHWLHKHWDQDKIPLQSGSVLSFYLSFLAVTVVTVPYLHSYYVFFILTPQIQKSNEFRPT